MRLIDADALKDRMQNLAYDDWSQGVSTTWANAYSECADMIEDAPTVEMERQNGKWMQEYKEATTRHCSNCDFIVVEEEANNFCPNCGADMRGDEE